MAKKIKIAVIPNASGELGKKKRIKIQTARQAANKFVVGLALQ